MNAIKLNLIVLFGIAGSHLLQAQTPAALMYDSNVGAVNFAAGDVKAALQQNGYVVTDLPPGDPSAATQTVRVILTTQAATVPGKPAISGLSAQGYAIQKVVDGAATNWWVIGYDARGVMYGGLELAEAVRLADGLAGVTDRQTNPYLGQRGIKFNIPLDARSPSYSDDSSSAQPNIAQMWDTAFWTGFLDNMARHRYNMLSLWSLHPFPSMVRVPDYPNVALADVKQKSDGLWDASLLGTGMYNPSWTLTTVKTMTIEEKITFWRWVMQYAKDRGIDISIITWNIFTYGTESSGYGITDSSTNAVTKDYFRKSVRAMFNTYPLLAGIGLTTGENMEGVSSSDKEQWAWDTYGLGVSDAMADAENPASEYYAPGRVVRLIHRAHMADLNNIISYFQGLPGANNADSTLAFSFKYSQAHMHSSTSPQFIYQNNWFNTIPPGKKVYLTVRNDDMYNMRWGDPDFARTYLTNLPDLSKIAGFYMGPDGYTWGREFLSTEPDSPRQQVIEKMWYSFLLYGRLAFEPTLPNGRFQALLGERFPEVVSSNLFQGWGSVSKILPLLTRFYWGALDFQWYPEACWSSSGFESVQNFINPRWDPMNSNEDGDRPLLMSVKQYVNGDAANGRLNPLEVADLLQQHADAGFASVQGLTPGANKELRLTLGDIRAMAWLGRYYAAKIRGAVELYRYQSNGLAIHHANARTHLIAASGHWSEYAALWSSQYVSQTLTRMGSTPVNIAGIQANVNADIPAALLPTTPENIPWVENFTLPIGTRSDGAPTSWTTTRASGVFEVNAAGQLSVNDAGGEAVFTSAPIDISGGAVNLSLAVLGAGGLDAGQDYLRLYVKIDGGAETLVQDVTGLLAAATWTSNGITGNTLQVIVRTLVTANAEFYYLDNLKVESQQNITTYNLTSSATNGSIALNPSGGVYADGTVVTLTATPNNGYQFGSWSGALSGATNPTTLTMDGNKSVTANFNAVPIDPLVASYTFDTDTVSGTAVTNITPGTLFDGTLVSSSIATTPNALSGTGSLDVSGGSRMTINGGTAMLDGWKGVDVHATVNLDTLTGQHSVINVGHTGSSFGTRFRFTIRDGGKLMLGLRFTDNASANFLGYYAGDFNTTVLAANTTYDIGVAVDATNASSGTPGTVKFRYRLAGTPTWTYLAGSLAGTTSGNNVADWRNGWTGASSGVGVGARFDGSAGESFDGRIDNLTITNTTQSYVSWIGGFDVGSLVAAGDDPDKDGIANSLENLFGTRPDQFNKGTEALGRSGNVFTFTHPVSSSPAVDVSLFYEWSTDMQNWNGSGQSFGGIEVALSPSIAGGTATVTATLTSGSTPELFVRARATGP